MIATPGGLRSGWVRVRDQLIEAVGEGRPPAGEPTVVVPEGVIAPGFVDIHVHGAVGHDVNGPDPEAVAVQVRAVAAHHAAHGTTSILPTTVSAPVEQLERAARGVALAATLRRAGEATILGINLEGPWLAPSRRGAHDPRWVAPPDPDGLARVIAAAGNVRLVTVAPEQVGALALIRAARAAGVVASVGHTAASFEETVAAFDAGARHVTHLGNAMPGVDRRQPGPVTAALLDGRATVEVIADGHHLHPGFVRLAATSVGRRLVAVTDAVAACGMVPGRYRLGGLDVTLEGDTAALSDQPATLAGSVLTMDRAVGNLVRFGLPPADAIAAATSTPAGVIGATTKGRLEPGTDADLVVLDRSWTAVATVAKGIVAHDPLGRLATIALVRAGSDGDPIRG